MAQRGEALRSVLRLATDLLTRQGEASRADSRLLNHLYFQNKSAAQAAAALNMGRATLFRRRAEILPRLAEIFARCINPALRQERPARPKTWLVRAEILRVCSEGLRAGQRVGLTGPAGIGKTALGAELMAALALSPRFGSRSIRD